MIAILEWTYSNIQQNIKQLQTPTMDVTINKKGDKAHKDDAADDDNREVIRMFPSF